jgi:hypothetical protein
MLGWSLLVLNALLVPLNLLVGNYFGAAISGLWAVLLFWILRD